jgi:threonine/homoserine/homoserine lactone efflux protein
MRRFLMDGLLAGIFSVLGAAVADGIYCAIAGLGITWLIKLLVQEKSIIELVGAIVLILLGVWLYFTDPRHSSSGKTERITGYIDAFGTTFLLMITYPIPIVVFTATFAALGIHGWQGDFASTAILVFGVFAGSAFWSPVLAAVILTFKPRLNAFQLKLLNRFSGGIIFMAGFLLGLKTYFH